MSESMIEANRTPIAVVGVSALFPGSLDSAGFWRDILASRDLIQDVPPSHWLIEDYYDADPKAPDKTYARRGAFLGDIDFDALSWGVPPSIMPATDTSQLLGLIVAQRVLQDALGAQFETASRERTSVILGVTSAQELLASMVGRLQRPVWVKALREAGIPEDEVQAICDNISDHYTPWQESTFPGLLGNVVAGRIANRLDLGGTNCVTDAACASTFSALHMAIGELQLGSSDLVIAGGVDTLNDIFMFMCFSKTPALSATGDCRPFSAKGDGTMLGEGLGMVALKRLADAERDGDRIYAVIKGVGTSSDGRSKSVYAPVAAGQARALKRAYKNAGHSPATVELVEAHGTGTIAGDAAEFNGLRLAFEDDGDRQQWCALGSVKSQIGHTKAAAGAAGLFKAVMALHHKTLPPTLKVEAPNPKLDLSNSPFYLSLHKRPWVRGSEHPRRASVSSFGFGGSNYHLALEEYTQERTARRLDSFDHKLVVLGAQSASALVKDTREAAKSATDKGMLAWLSRSSQAAYDSTAKARLALLAKDGEDLQAKLEASAARIESDPTASFVLPDGTAYGVGDREGEVAFLFSGQGSQYVGMGADVAMAWDAAICAWDEAADQTFDPALPLAEVVFPRPGFEADADAKNHARLTATEWAQPAIGTASLALLGILDQIGVKPTMVGGHSFGEVTALHAAGVLGREDFLKVARKRGELMAEAAALPGAMTVVSKPIDEVRALVERLGEGVTVANHNHPTQVVLSGPTDAIEALEGKLKAEGVRSKRLSVATAFHSPVVAGSCKPFGAFLETVNFSAPELPVFANCKAAPYEEAASAIRETLSGAIAQPVRFVEMVEAMYAAGARTFVEVGPQAVLTGLTGRILGKQSHAAIALDRKGKSGADMLFMALAKLAAAGVPMDLGALWSEYREVVDPATVKRPKLAVPINGSNYGKPYPPKNGAAGLPKPNPKRTVTNAPSVPALPKVDASLAHAGGQPLPTSSAPLALASAPVHTPRPFAEPSAMPNPTHPYPANPSPATPEPAAFSAAGPSPVSLPASAHAGWIAAFQETQRQTAEAHASFQQAMASSHAAFLQTAESSFQGLAAMVSGQPVIAAQPGLAPNLAPVFAPAQPQFAAAPVSPVFAPPIASAAPIAVPSPRPAP
ncbi:MAG: beta-ketoacyl synthase N-terminal-like domain-containing protein, partial [Planctomycetota bacterium]